ncbi:LlaJI family restriction endonuclease [Tumebacillus flagellatus]|uniref:LlaJI restriction endonuclease n=1 Tax=Tumebacillus flagellatus TaxID=1157490 RepID=A0A074LYM9_9BACL|nr:LlaJI family restriction endonuclease [Tumebacillus flagellatus]KEO85118.1 hypothetical protein EL26_00735 [Tumebacillus flagellatus]
MSPTISYFIEQRRYDIDLVKKEQFDLKNLFERGLCKKVEKSITFLFTGIIVSSKKLLVVFPKGYKIPENDSVIVQHVKNLAITLLRYREEHNLDYEENELLFGGGFGEREGLGAALWLLRDFTTYGLINRETRIKKVGTGPNIDWAATTRSVDPYIVRNKPYYLEYLVRKTNSDKLNRLKLIHNLAIQKCIKYYGWLWGPELDGFDMDSIAVSYDDNIIDAILKTELSATNIDREIKLIQMLRSFLLGSNEEENSNKIETLATPFFHNVWEHICGYLFENEYTKLKKYIPEPIWNWKGKNTGKKLRQIPDILYRHDGVLFVLDAKYYETERNLPGWHDLVKQYFYAYSLSAVENSYRNVLIFPTFSDKLFEYNGNSEIKGRPDLGRIEAVSLNLYIALSEYSKRGLLVDIRSKLNELITLNE